MTHRNWSECSFFIYRFPRRIRENNKYGWDISGLYDTQDKFTLDMYLTTRSVIQTLKIELYNK